MINIFRFPQNPDPNVHSLLKEMWLGLKDAYSGKMRTRYDILKDLKATDEQQAEMRHLVAFLVLDGVGLGICLSLLVALLYYGLFIMRY